MEDDGDNFGVHFNMLPSSTSVLRGRFFVGSEEDEDEDADEDDDEDTDDAGDAGEDGGTTARPANE